MESYLWAFAVAAVVLGGIGLGLYRESQRRAERRSSPGAPLSRPLPADVLQRARERIDAGKRVLAVKELREATGYDLRSAKAVVDALSEGRSVPTLGESAED
ncbi:hypothetical protein [Streptomonospora wellingtoniae]|uniref:Ribosomal protein L7/L12 C-terminal domain-containing protein n=1 Tax=Streptomonospora wellingtoniae TaxID=3075544 RepID=A0ABU2KTA8_9ACTN|nr:hypothetical protein [Streptomonospora sp. DSM 45055]MDT0302524.1 hypothetical protein [Streptomonospora sp. DSM 45055]